MYNYPVNGGINMADVIMPKLGLTMEEGTVAEWHVAVGDQVNAGDLLCDIETDKITNKVEAKAAGTVTKILVQEGDTVPVYTVLAVIE